MTLTQFLITWLHFVSTHICLAWQPDSLGWGNHVAYGGNCNEAFRLAQSWHTEVSWDGLDQGGVAFP
jgi:hypothetical protein